MNSLKKCYYILSVGVLLNVSAYVGILTLQSSIHVQHNTGIISASVLYLTAAILSIVATPVLLLHLGPKWSLIIGELGFLIYTIANYNATLASLVIGGVFGALGEALIWPATPVYIITILKNEKRKKAAQEPTTSNNARKRAKSFDHERNMWLGSFYGILQNCLIWGNFITYISLYGARHLNVKENVKVSTHLNVSHCGTSFTLYEEDKEDLSKYVPKSSSSVYLMLSLFLLFQIISVVVHSFYLPRVASQISENYGKRTRDIIKDTLKQTIQHVNSFDQTMLIFINLYFGFLLSYSRGVFSQAFVSCILGVQSIGLVMMLYGCTNAMTAFISGQAACRYGLRPVVLFGFVFDLISYSLQLAWNPSFKTRYYVFGISAMVGISEGVWQFAVIAMTALYFEEQQEIAFGAINLWCELAVFIGFLLTPTLSVEIRIYCMIGLMVLGCVGYAVVDIRRKAQENNSGREIHIASVSDNTELVDNSENF